MIAQLVELIRPLAWLTVALGAWALWAVAGLTPWTWGLMGFVALYVTSRWHWSGSATVDAVAVAALFGYICECLYDDRAACWWCKGRPRRYHKGADPEKSGGRPFHFCLLCGGRGYRVRWGAKWRHRPPGDD